MIVFGSAAVAGPLVWRHQLQLRSPAWRPKRARVLHHRLQRRPGGRLADWGMLLDGAQGQQRRALGRRDASQARDVQALVPALRPQYAQRSTSAGFPQPHRPIKAAAGATRPRGREQVEGSIKLISRAGLTSLSSTRRFSLLTRISNSSRAPFNCTNSTRPLTARTGARYRTTRTWSSRTSAGHLGKRVDGAIGRTCVSESMRAS
jgi:hypothetical protein